MGSKQAITLSRLLDAMLALPAARRAAWVEGLGREADPLKPRLRALLARAGGSRAQHMLDTLPKLETSRAPKVLRFDDSGHAPGTQIGPYRLTRRLGVGAMGVVWLADRPERGAWLQVALKFAHMAPRREDLLARLSRERQLLAALDHPNIARLYDAGVTAEGQPYLVLEYIAGRVLDAHCSALRLPLRARLQLFSQLVSAVAHAHDRQIVHRDLKPANVMVTAEGTLRLLDFGVGRLLTDGIPPALQLSVATGRPLTPAYASPEQVLGEPVGFASDIYSLGVILYELLCGVSPYRYRHGSNRALREAILETMPPPPSAAAADRSLQVCLQGELDALVLRALNKRPDQRYPSARAFAAEIERV
jgi:serine/threonine protein kinase